MTTLTQKQWIYRRQPVGQITAEHYELVEQPLSTTLGDGEVLIEARWFSVDPYMRIGQSTKPTYDTDPHPLDTAQQGGVVAQVLASNAPGFAAGDWVQSYTGWQTHARVHASGLKRIDPDLAPVTTALGVLGMPAAKPSATGCATHWVRTGPSTTRPGTMPTRWARKSSA
jgi:NADPH-dependent curcumin reductase CurA